MDLLDAVFKEFYNQICDIGKWIFAIRMAISLLKSTESFDLQGSIKVLINGGFSYGLLYSVIDILDQVQKTYGGAK